jgi:hypothetical protein
MKDFDQMRMALQPAGGRLVLESFIWCVFDGMHLDPGTNASLYKYLNDTFYPFTYAHMRRMADFQNRVFRRYAETHGIDFVDVAADFPLDPRLFGDAIHMVPSGVKLMAWKALQDIVTLLDRLIAAGDLPRLRIQPDPHPEFVATGRTLVPIADLLVGCSPASAH